MHVNQALLAFIGSSLPTAVLALPPLDNGSSNTSPLVKTIQAPGRVLQVIGGPLLSGPQAMKKTYEKYGKHAPSAVILAATNRTGSVQATDLPFDQAYLCPVTIGGQTFMLDFDSASSDLWMFSTKLSAALCSTHTCYHGQGQPIANETFDVQYGDGSSASGTLYADTVDIGGVTATMAVEAATSVSATFASGKADGIVGLGFTAGSTCRPLQCFTYMDQVAPTLSLPIFTATLRKGEPGEYDFGFIDPKKFTGSIAYTNITHAIGGSGTYWSFDSSGYAIGHRGAKRPHAMTAIADTGTALAYVDQVVLDDFYAPVNSAHLNATYGAYIFKCSEAVNLPHLAFFMGGRRHGMPGEYAVYGQLADPVGYCFGGVQPNTGIGFTLLGDVFLKSQFVVFDHHVPRIGFARQAGLVK